jgi:hypothetical protein
MTVMSSTPSPAPPGFSRRTLLGVSTAGLALLVAGCTSAPRDQPPAVTDEQADRFGAQVAVQQALVAAYAAAGATDAALKTAVAELAGQAGEQLAALKAAAPGSRTAAASSTGAAPVGADARAWLRGQVAAAATSHATACVDQVGARAALLGSIAAGLRGQDGRLA